MKFRLKSNIRYVLPDVLCALLFLFFAILYGIYCFDTMESIPLKSWIVLLLGFLFCAAFFVFFLCYFLLNWQWVTIDHEIVSVRCVLFEIRSIPISQVKRCFICRSRMGGMKGWVVYRDCIVIDTIKSRRGHTIPDGYSHRKQKYIILLDTLENRIALKECGLQL